jgi:hypothetical protein
MLLIEGQTSDHKGARLMLQALPPAAAMITDMGYDSDWFPRGAQGPWDAALHSADKEPQNAPRLRQDALPPAPEDPKSLRQSLKDWRHIATRYDRCAHTFFSAICITAAVAFYLTQ